MLRLSQRTVYKLLAEGRLPAMKVGGQWRFDRDEVRAWLSEGGNRSQDRETASNPTTGIEAGDTSGAKADPRKQGPRDEGTIGDSIHGHR